MPMSLHELVDASLRLWGPMLVLHMMPAIKHERELTVCVAASMKYWIGLIVLYELATVYLDIRTMANLKNTGRLLQIMIGHC